MNASDNSKNDSNDFKTQFTCILEQTEDFYHTADSHRVLHLLHILGEFPLVPFLLRFHALGLV